MLSNALSKLKTNFVSVLSTSDYQELGTATGTIVFSNGTTLKFDYWRLIKAGKERVSSFDHAQKYGLPAAVDAITQLQKELHGNTVVDVQFDKETGDLLFQFTEDMKLQIFGFSAYEVWKLNFPDGTGEYSNYAKSS